MVPDFEHAYSIALQDRENLIDSLRNVVATMDHESLSELRSLQRAPDEIEELLVAVIIIMKGPSADFSWTKGAKRLMANLDRYIHTYIHTCDSIWSTMLTHVYTLRQRIGTSVALPFAHLCLSRHWDGFPR